MKKRNNFIDEKIKKAIYVVGGIIALWIIVQILFVVFWDCMGCPGNPSFNDNPQEASENLLKAMDESSYQEKVSNTVNFTKENSINAEDLATKTGLQKNQICLNVSNELKENGFEAKNQSLITYSGETLIKVKIAGICAAKEEYISDISGNLIQNLAPMLSNNGFNFVESGCSDYCLDKQKCCVLLLIKANE
ncbi:MAG: hypothetical protein ABH850_07380 [Candidatus Micrarchaeota archaeon]|nr:hypothetical protein [Candidatus Micrarchaeota archaeon]